MIRAVVFDCGGVLCRPKRGRWLLPSDLEEILGGPIPEIDPARAQWAHAAAAHFLDEGQRVTCEGHEIALRVSYTREMNRLLETNLTPAQIRQIAESLTLDDARYAFYEDVPAALSRLREKYTVGVLSNAMPSLARALAAAGLSRLLDCMIISTLVGAQKPEARIYEICLSEIGVAPECVAFVDDLEQNLLAARRAGMKAVRMARDVYTLDPAPAFAWDGPSASDLAEVEALVNHGDI